jgi:hypothetical protein
MKLVLRWYLRLVLSRPIIRAMQWTPEERNAFDLFCRTSCGIKLFEFLRQIVANTTFNAVYQNSVSANARARGMQDLLAVLHRLRVFPELQEESDLASLTDSEPQGPNARAKADSWRPIGGRGAIG